jgi:hypothetical protein
MSYEVDKFINCRINPATGKIQLFVQWKGFSTADNTWEDLDNLYSDVPTLVALYQKKLRLENHELSEEVDKFINQKS